MIEFLYGPKQIGKTKMAIDTYLKNPDNTAIFVGKLATAAHVSEVLYVNGFMNESKHRAKIAPNIFSVNSIRDGMCGRYYDDIILDEFDFFGEDSKIDLFHALLPCAKNITILTTPKIIRRIDIYTLVRFMKHKGMSYPAGEDIQRMLLHYEVGDASKFHYAWFGDVVGIPSVRVSKLNLSNPYLRYPTEDEIGKDLYKTEVKGILFEYPSIQ